MKYIVVALSGAADQANEERGEKTPFEMAKIPNLHAFAKTGRVGQVHLAPERLHPYPDVTLMNLLGYEADRVYTGRGPLEAANMELKLEDNEIPFRMNFVTEYDGRMADPTAGNISTKESRALINFLNKKISSDFVRFFPGSGYRHVVVLKDAQGIDALSARTWCPHDIVGQPLEKHLPHGPGGELMKKLMYDTRLLLQDHEINGVRIDLRENPASMIWIWGQGVRPQIGKFSDKTGCQGAMISDAEYAMGIARLGGLTVMDTSHRHHEELGDHYAEKAKVLMEAVAEKDLVCLHLRECDDAGREGDLRGKVSALEAADYFIFSRIREYMEKHKDTRVLVTPCHVLPWESRKRTKDDVPFVMAGKNIMADESQKFTEITARASGLRLRKSTELMTSLMAG